MLKRRFFLLRKARFMNLSANLYVDRRMNNSKKNTSSTYPQLLLPVTQPNSRLPTRLRGMTQSDSHRPSFSQEAYATIRQRYLSSPGSRPLPSRGTTSPLPSWVPGSQLSSHSIKRPSSSGCILPNQSATVVPISHTQTITRQTSIQRLQPPPTPPIHELPPRPSDTVGEPPLESQVEGRLDSQPNCSGSSSSSSISFVSSTSSNEKSVDAFDPTKEQDSENRSFVANLQPEPKIADNLTSRPLAEIVRVPLYCLPSERPPSVQTPTSTLPLEASQILQESKSYDRFEHGHRVSITPSSQSLEPLASLAQDARYGTTLSHASTSNSVSASPMQQRVFSGSNFRRPSTSSGITRLDHGIPSSASPSKAWPANMLKLRSFWEDHPPSPTQSDHLSQPIISPDLLAQIETDLEDCSSLGSLPLLSIPSDSGQERTMRATTAPSDRYSEVNSSSISPQSLSDVSKIPLLSAKSITVPMTETGNLSGTIVGRTSSLVKVRPSTTSSLSRRPATASGTTSLGPLLPMPTLHEPEVKNFRPVHIDTLSPTHSGMIPSAPISLLSLRKSQQAGSNASNVKLPPLQLRSLPPPPRPRAKAETVTQLQKLPEEPRQKRGRAKNSIGIDFGPEQRRVISPSIQPNVYHPPSQPMVRAATFGTCPIPPGDPSRPLGRQPEPPDGVQEIPSQKVLSKVNLSNERKLSHRISLQRKPSFLDIDKDDDTEADGISDSQLMKSTLSGTPSFSHTISATESFLEFERESFDTIRNQS